MAESLRKRIGRTIHSIHLLTTGGVRPLSPGDTPFPIGSDEEAGFILARDTLYKDLLRNILRTDTTSTIYHIGKNSFSVHTTHGIIHVPSGIMKNIGLGTFPHSTGLTIYNPQGFPINQLTFVGNPKIQG